MKPHVLVGEAFLAGAVVSLCQFGRVEATGGQRRETGRDLERHTLAVGCPGPRLELPCKSND